MRKIYWPLCLLALLIFMFPAMALDAKSVVFITDYGAVGDGATLNTKAIQRAIEACAAKGGGTVCFPTGTFLSGTIYLQDHITLYLESGAVLLGSRQVQDYPLTLCRYPSGSDRYVGRALIWGEDLQDITITGRGVIDGQGRYFADNLVPAKEWQELIRVFSDTTRFAPEPLYINRPFLLRFISCRNVLVEKVTLRKPAMWLQHYLNCDDVTIRDANLFSHGSPNNDLIDIDGCRNVVITGCIGDSDDDGITLKSTSAAPVQNVTISDCIVRTRTNAIKAGTESSGGFQDITITNCMLKNSVMKSGFSGRAEGLAGIALEIVDGGSLDRVTISNITIEEMAAPIFLRLGNRGRPYRPHQAKAPVGTFRNVNISNLIATGAGRNGCSILGTPGHYIENVSLTNVSIQFDGGGTRQQAEAEYPEGEAEYPESTRWGDLPAYGFFCRHVDGLTLRDVKLTCTLAEERSPLILEDGKNINLFQFNGQVSATARAQMILKNCHNVFVNQCTPPAAEAFMAIEKNSAAIKVIGNDLRSVKRPFSLDESVSLSALEVAYNLPVASSLFSSLQPTITRDETGLVTIHSFTADAKIYYTLDGAEVTRGSNEYLKPFLQVAEGEVKARAFQGESVSACAVARLPRLQVPRPEIHPSHSFLFDTMTIGLSCKTPDAKIYYSSDESLPFPKWTLYQMPLVLRKSVSIYARASKPDHQSSEIAVSRHELLPAKNGVLFKYYLGEWDKLPPMLELQPEKTGRIKRFRLEEIETRSSNYALLMLGFIKVAKTGNYTFYCGSNDGSQLYLDNALLIDNDGYHGFEEKSAAVHLDAGIHLIEVRYFQMGGTQKLQVSWQGEGFKKTELASELFAAF